MAVTTVNLTTASIEVDKFNGTLSARESGALSAYNSDMKKLIRKVKKLPDYTDDTYYIMLVAKSDNPALGGFMPVNSNFGFVFAQANSGAGQMNRTIAHELAHGAFRLWHTFSSENLYTAQQGTTRNLMDYNGTNSELYKYQWDYIHNPQQGIVRWMVEDDESESVLDNLVHYYLQVIHDANANNKNELNLLVENGSIETNEKFREKINYLKMHLDGGLEKLQPAKIDLLKQNIKKTTRLKTEYDVTIDPRERTVETDGTEFVKYSFHKLVNGENTRDIAIQILVKNDEAVWLDYFLYGVLPFTDLKLYEGKKEKAKDAIMYITAEPEPVMPDVRVSVKSNYKIQMQLKIEYTARKTWPGHNDELVRNDITYFPNDNADSWQDLQSEEIWDIDFGNKFRGGRAVVYCKIKNQLVDSIVFHIRGKNPQLTTVLAYAQTIDASWYVPKIIRQESSNDGDIGKQFNTGTPSATNQFNGMPCWGNPYGWGIKQLDNLGNTLGYYTAFNNRWGASPDELWNWKLNVQKGLQLFNNSKLTEARNKWNKQLSKKEMKDWLNEHEASSSYSMKIGSSTVASEKGTIVDEIIAGSGSNTETIVSEENPQGNNRSLIDADAIRRYNGGSYYDKLEVPTSDSSEEPKWIITKTNESNLDYVNEVCGKQGW